MHSNQHSKCENHLSTCWPMCAFLMYSTGGPIGPTNPRRLELVVKHVPCAISWWFTSLSCSKAVYPLVVNRVNYTNYPGIRVSSLRIPEESLDMNTGSPQFLDLSCANPHVCVCVCIVYLYIISYADVYLPVYTYVLKLNTGCTSSVTIASL